MFKVSNVNVIEACGVVDFPVFHCHVCVLCCDLYCVCLHLFCFPVIFPVFWVGCVFRMLVYCLMNISALSLLIVAILFSNFTVLFWCFGGFL